MILASATPDYIAPYLAIPLAVGLWVAYFVVRWLEKHKHDR